MFVGGGEGGGLGRGYMCAEAVFSAFGMVITKPLTTEQHRTLRVKCGRMYRRGRYMCGRLRCVSGLVCTRGRARTCARVKVHSPF